jgi:hypothetical protein
VLYQKLVPDVGLDEDVAHFYFRQLVNGVVHMDLLNFAIRVAVLG